MPNKADIATGKRIKELRIELHLTQNELAEASGIHENTIARLERGMHTISTQTARKLAKALGVDPGAILG